MASGPHQGKPVKNYVEFRRGEEEEVEVASHLPCIYRICYQDMPTDMLLWSPVWFLTITFMLPSPLNVIVIEIIVHSRAPDGVNTGLATEV
jgi:hypothetical protein